MQLSSSCEAILHDKGKYLTSIYPELVIHYKVLQKTVFSHKEWSQFQITSQNVVPWRQLQHARDSDTSQVEMSFSEWHKQPDLRKITTWILDTVLHDEIVLVVDNDLEILPFSL